MGFPFFYFRLYFSVPFWMHGFLCSLFFNPLQLLFYLGSCDLILIQWELPSGWLSTWSHLSLVTPLISDPRRCPKFNSYTSALDLKSDISQGSLVPFRKGWYIDTTVLVLGIPIATRLSLLLGFLGRSLFF